MDDTPIFAVGTEDYSQAEWLEHYFRGKWKYDHGTKKWHHWNGIRWAPDQTTEIRYAVAELAATMMPDAVSESSKKAMLKLFSVNPIDRALDALASMPSVAMDGSEWDTIPYLLGCENGIVDLRKNALIENPSPDMLVTKTTGCTFEAFPREGETMDQRAPIFTRFLMDVTSQDESLAMFLLLWYGYGLFGFTPEQRFLLMTGIGRNGKGALKHAVMKAVGEYAVQPDANMYMRTRHGAARSDGARADLMLLKGARIAFFSEPEGGQFSEEILKAHTGGDTITARYLYSNVMNSWQPTHSITFLVNNAPDVEDVGPSMVSRVMVADFRERYDGSREDKQLYGKLEKEKDGILAILCWAAKQWYDAWSTDKGGLEMPERVVNASKEFISQNDPIARCLEVSFEFGAEKDVSSTIAYEAYIRWHAGNEEAGEAMSQVKFSQGLERKGFKKVRTKNGVRWIGLRPLSAWQLAAQEEPDD
jgi:P4 family phage/plasmid primase-like protien